MSSPPASIGWTETATDLGFVAPDAYTSSDIVCHRNSTNAKLSASIAAGGTIIMDWNTWPTSHHGPVIDYLAPCNGDCATVDKTTLSFVKLAQQGLITPGAAGDYNGGSWATDALIANNNSWTITIPSAIAPGNYVLRHEIIALHSASSNDGAQNYPQCVNLQVTGSGTDSLAPADGTLGEALYKETDPGILVNIFTPGLTYTIPGPAVYSATAGSGSGSSTATQASGAVSTTAASASVALTSASVTPTTFATSVMSSTAAVASSAAAEATPAPAPANDDDDDDDDTCEL